MSFHILVRRAVLFPSLFAVGYAIRDHSVEDDNASGTMTERPSPIVNGAVGLAAMLGAQSSGRENTQNPGGYNTERMSNIQNTLNMQNLAASSGGQPRFGSINSSYMADVKSHNAAASSHKGLLDQVQMLYKSPAPPFNYEKYNAEQLWNVGKLPDDQQTEAIRNGWYNQLTPQDGYFPTDSDKKVNQDVFQAFKGMADMVVKNDNKKGTSEQEQVVANMNLVDKFVKEVYEEQPTAAFQDDWASRHQTMNHDERMERVTEVEFVLSVVEKTLVSYEDALNRRAGSVDDLKEALQIRQALGEAQLKSKSALRTLQGVCGNVVILAKQKARGKWNTVNESPKQPEEELLDRINDLLVPDAQKTRTFADIVEARRLEQVRNVAARVLASGDDGPPPLQ